MKLLTKLTPAETMILINTASSLKDMMKFTFMDLLLKKIINIKVEKKKVFIRDKYAKKVEIIKSYNYIVKGKNFNYYSPEKHETVFLSAYDKTTSIKILFKHLIKMAYENAYSNDYFRKVTFKSSNLDGLLKQNILQKMFGGISLTSKGIATQKNILNYLNPIDKNISKLLRNNEKKAVELLMNLGGNMLLLTNLDISLLKKIDKELLKEYKSLYKESYDYENWFDYFDFDYDSKEFDYFTSDFESTMESFSSEFDSAGCSSYDSGCSSCSGCGGCGGCS